MEHDDMASEHPPEKPAETARKPPRSGRPPAPPSPQTTSPLLNEGPELIRGGHC
jgi:hypothetical protein